MLLWVSYTSQQGSYSTREAPGDSFARHSKKIILFKKKKCKWVFNINFKKKSGQFNMFEVISYIPQESN